MHLQQRSKQSSAPQGMWRSTNKNRRIQHVWLLIQGALLRTIAYAFSLPPGCNGNVHSMTYMDLCDPTTWLQIQYCFKPECTVMMDVQVDLRSFMPDELQGEISSLPRIGLEMTVPKALQQCVWFGRYVTFCRLP
jgi:hypothetical protein